MAELYTVFIKPQQGIEMRAVEAKLDLSIDWYRYFDGCYLVYSKADAVALHARFFPLVSNGGLLLILNADPYEFEGMMPKDLWDWLKDKKKKLYPYD